MMRQSTVPKSYMLEKPPGPGKAELFLHQTVVPLAIDVAAAGEIAIQGLSRRTGVKPSVIVGSIAGGLVLLGIALRQARSNR